MSVLQCSELERLPLGSVVRDDFDRDWEKRQLPGAILREAGHWWVCLGEPATIRNSFTLTRDFSPIPGTPPTENPITAPDKIFYVDPATGGKKEVKLAQLGAIDPTSILVLAEVAGYGAQKYEQDDSSKATYNYLKGYPWSLNFNSAQRHLLAFWSGENLDPESGLPHLAHAAWQCLALLSFMNHELGTDDRWVLPVTDADVQS